MIKVAQDTYGNTVLHMVVIKVFVIIITIIVIVVIGKLHHHLHDRTSWGCLVMPLSTQLRRQIT